MLYALAILLAVHGLIHTLGFVKAFGLAALPELALPISPSLGLAWLAAGLALLGAAVAVVAGARWWWLPAALGVVVSQIVIVASWGDAKFGTIANVLLVVALAVTALPASGTGAAP